MPRTLADAKLETRAARTRLLAGKKPHFKTLVPGKLHLGYRRKAKETPGTWLVRRYIGGERYQIGALGLADDFQEADAVSVLSFADAQRIALAKGAKEGTISKAALTVADAIAAYVDWLKVHRASGEDAERRAQKLILPSLGKIKISDLTSTKINHWRDKLAEAPALKRTAKGADQNYKAAPSTPAEVLARRASANRVLTILKAALNKSFSDGLTDDDTAWRRVKPFRGTQAARPGYLSIKEAQKLIGAADKASGFRDLVYGALLTGCRYGELTAARVKDFHRAKLSIPRSKSGKPRDIVLTDEAVKFFETLTRGRSGDEFLFLRGDGGRWLSSQQARPMFEACLKAKIVPIGFHQLRHTWASHAVMNGMPLMVVARNLGHASTVMVEKHYGHLTEGFIEAAIRESAPRFGRSA